MGQRVVRHARRQIADTGNAADAHSHVIGRDGFHHRGHAHRVHAKLMQQADLRRRFKGRSGELGIHALLQADVLLCSRFLNQVSQLQVIHVGHIRKTHAQLVDVRADQRIGRPQGNMVGQQHKIPCMEGRIDAAGRIGQKQDLRPHHLHQPGRKHHVGNRVALIIMHPSLHADHRDLSHIAENELSGMARYGGHGESFDLMIVQLRLHTDIVRIVPQSGPENNGNLRLEVNFLPEAFITFQ